MLDGGNAVDAAVATLFCMGVVNPQSAGIGGGLLMTIYNSSSARASCLNARESAPMAATKNMFDASPSLAIQGQLTNHSITLYRIYLYNHEYFIFINDLYL